MSVCGAARITGTCGVGGVGRGLFCEPLRDERRPLSRRFDLEEFREEEVVAICAMLASAAVSVSIVHVPSYVDWQHHSASRSHCSSC